MDAPFVASHKENVHVGGGKPTSLLKPDKLKPVRTAGKERKALVDLKNNYEPTVSALKEIDLKQKAAIIGNKVKSNAKIVGKENKALAELCRSKKTLVSDLSKRTNPSSKSALLESLGKGNTYLGHVLTDEEIQQCYEWAKDGIEEIGGYSWLAKHETRLFLNQNLSEIMASAIGVPISELESSFRSNDEDDKTNESELNISQSFSGCLTSMYAPETLEDPFGVAGIVLDEYPLPELKLKDD